MKKIEYGFNPGQRFGRWTILDRYVFSARGEKEISLPLRLRYGKVCTGAFIEIWRLPELRLSAQRTGLPGNGLQFTWADLRRIACDRPQQKAYRDGGVLDVPVQLRLHLRGHGSGARVRRKTHCGCKSVRSYATSNITGRRFGRLTAMYPTKSVTQKGFVIWHCRCDCGNEPDVSYNNLMYCGQQSCGCRKKEHDQELGTLLTHVGGTSLEMIQSQKLPPRQHHRL